MLNLYAMPISPFASKTQYFLEEAGIPYKYNSVNLFDDAGRRQLAIYNPLGKVPAIELNGFHLGESNAIMRYLADRYQKHSFYPLNLEERARVDMLVEFGSNHLNRWLNTLAWGLHWAEKFGMKANPSLTEEARVNALQMLERFEKMVSGRAFLAGPELTLADCNLLPFLSQWKVCKVPLASYPTLERWVSRLTERPAWQKVEKVVDEGAKALARGR
jgi:glutathione S-transferase